MQKGKSFKNTGASVRLLSPSEGNSEAISAPDISLESSHLSAQNTYSSPRVESPTKDKKEESTTDGDIFIDTGPHHAPVSPAFNIQEGGDFFNRGRSILPNDNKHNQRLESFDLSALSSEASEPVRQYVYRQAEDIVSPDLFTSAMRPYLYHYLTTDASDRAGYETRPTFEVNHGTEEEDFYAKYKGYFLKADKGQHAVGTFYDTYVVERAVARQVIIFESWFGYGAKNQLLSTPMNCCGPLGCFVNVMLFALEYIRFCLFKYPIQHISMQFLRTQRKLSALRAGNVNTLYSDTTDMWISAVVSLAVAIAWLAMLATDDLRGTAGFYVMTAYTFSPLVMAALDPRQAILNFNLQLKYALLGVTSAVSLIAWFATSFGVKARFQDALASDLCQEIKQGLSASNLDSPNDEYRNTECRAAWAAEATFHYDRYSMVTVFKMAMILMPVGYFVYQAIQHSRNYKNAQKTPRENAQKTPRENALKNYRTAVEHSVGERNVILNPVIDMQLVMALTAGLFVIVAELWLYLYAFRHYETERDNALGANFIQTQIDNGGIQPNTLASVLTNLCVGREWLCSAYDDNNNFPPALILTFMGVMLLAWAYQDFSQNDNSFRTVTNEHLYKASSDVRRSWMINNLVPLSSRASSRGNDQTIWSTEHDASPIFESHDDTQTDLNRPASVNSDGQAANLALLVGEQQDVVRPSTSNVSSLASENGPRMFNASSNSAQQNTSDPSPINTTPAPPGPSVGNDNNV